MLSHARTRGRVEAVDVQTSRFGDILGTPRFGPRRARLTPSQGAVDTLKMSQELLLRVCGKERDRESCGEAGSPSSSGENRPSESAHGKPDGRSPTSTSGPAASPNAHVHELDAQATRLRGMTQSVRGLLRSMPERDQGEVEDGSRPVPGRGPKREVPCVPPVEAVVGDGTGGGRGSAVPAAKQAEGDGRECKHLDAALGELRIAEGKVEGLQAEEARLNAEIERASTELSRVQELLNAKAKQVGEVLRRNAGILPFCLGVGSLAIRRDLLGSVRPRSKFPLLVSLQPRARPDEVRRWRMDVGT